MRWLGLAALVTDVIIWIKVLLYTCCCYCFSTGLLFTYNIRDRVFHIILPVLKYYYHFSIQYRRQGFAHNITCTGILLIFQYPEGTCKIIIILVQDYFLHTTYKIIISVQDCFKYYHYLSTELLLNSILSTGLLFTYNKITSYIQNKEQGLAHNLHIIVSILHTTLLFQYRITFYIQDH